MSGGETGAQGTKGESSTTQNVQIPDFLRPLFEQGAGAAGRTLSTAEGLTGGDLVAGFDPLQEQAFGQAEDVAGGAGGFIPTLQNLLLETARGQDVSSFLPESAFSALSGAAGGGGGIESLLPPEALAALTSTAGGDFLFGGEGIDAAVNAAVRSATPQIASAFGGTTGGLSGGLARQAVGDTAVDAFARQFGAERNRQLSAASRLADIQGTERGRGLSAAGLLGGFGSEERDRQLAAGERLPGAGLLSSNILSDIGGRRQDLEQRRLSAPLDATLELLRTIFGGIDFEQLLGLTQDRDFTEITAGVTG